MDVSSPVLPAAGLAWQPRPGQFVLTVVVKATFQLAPGVARLAAEQDPLVEHDQHWDDDPSRFLVAAADLVPAKQRVDVVYVGPPSSIDGAGLARLRVGALDKAFEIRGQRWAPLGPVAGRRTSPEADAWAREWTTRPMPDGVGTGVFNAAPADQQLDALADDAAIVLENLSPGAPTLSTSLPGMRPKVQLELRSGVTQTVALRADTLAIDGERGVASLVWRGQVPVEHPSQVQRLIVQASAPAAAASPGVAGLGPLDRKPARTAMAPDASAPSARALPFARGAGGPPGPTVMSGPPPSWSAFAATPGETAAIPVLADPPPSPARPPAAPAAPPLQPPAAASFQPPPVRAPAPVASAAPAWGASSFASLPTPPPGTGPRGPVAPPQHVPTAALGGVSAASDAAADGTPREGSARAAARGPSSGLRLLWHDEASVLRVRRRPEWRPILTRRERRVDARGGAFDSADAEDASEMLAVLREGSPAGEQAIHEALDVGFDDEGRFEPELLLVAGELALDLDELETLKAVVATATPLAGKDEALRRAVDAATVYLAAPGLVSPPAVARALTDDVRKAFDGWSSRPLPAGHLDAMASRALLERRAYRRRDVFGEQHLAAALFVPGSTTGIPTYLPEAVGKKLPLFLRLRTRILVEVHHREDEAEENAAALRAIAVARVLGEPGAAR